MNRREALGLIAAMPMVGTVKVVEAEPMPILAVFEFTDYLSKAGRAAIRKQWQDIFGGNPPFPAIILDGRAKVNFVSRESAEKIASGVTDAKER